MVAVKTSKDPNSENNVNELNENIKTLIDLVKDIRDGKTTAAATNEKKKEELEKKKEEEKKQKEERKERENYIKEIKQSIKDTLPANTRRELGSVALGGLTGINPVLIKTFGLDKLGKALLSGVGLIIKQGGKGLFGEFGKPKTNDKGSGTDDDGSAVAKAKQSPLFGKLDSIAKLLGKKKDRDKEDEQKEKESWLMRLLKTGLFALLLGGMLKFLGGAGHLLKDLVDSFLVHGLGLGLAGQVISDALPGALLGAKFGGLHGALVGGTISLAYFSIKRAINEFKQRDEQAKKGQYMEQARLAGLTMTQYSGMILGGIAGFKIYGIVGALVGAVIGLGAASIVDLYNNNQLQKEAGAVAGSNQMKKAASSVANNTNLSEEERSAALNVLKKQEWAQNRQAELEEAIKTLPKDLEWLKRGDPNDNFENKTLTALKLADRRKKGDVKYWDNEFMSRAFQHSRAGKKMTKEEIIKEMEDDIARAQEIDNRYKKFYGGKSLLDLVDITSEGWDDNDGKFKTEYKVKDKYWGYGLDVQKEDIMHYNNAYNKRFKIGNRVDENQDYIWTKEELHKLSDKKYKELADLYGGTDKLDKLLKKGYISPMDTEESARKNSRPSWWSRNFGSSYRKARNIDAVAEMDPNYKLATQVPTTNDLAEQAAKEAKDTKIQQDRNVDINRMKEDIHVIAEAYRKQTGITTASGTGTADDENSKNANGGVSDGNKTLEG